MPYTPITTIAELQAQYAANKPGGTEPASDLDDAIHQLQGFLVAFLAKAHTDVGDLSMGAVKATTFDPAGTGTIPSSALAGDIDGSKLSPVSVDDSRLDDGAAIERVIATGAVTETKLGTGAVTVDKIGAGAITTVKIGDDQITGAKIADGTITNDHVNAAANIAGSKLLVGSIPATAMAVPAPALTDDFGLLIVDQTTAADNKVANIGGALSATYHAGTNTILFSLTAGGSSDTACGRFGVSTSGAVAATGAWHPRQNWTRIQGLAEFYVVASTGGGLTNDKLVLTTPGVYIVLFSLSTYSTESTQCRLVVNGDTANPYNSNSIFVPVGSCALCHGLTALATVNDNEYLQLEYFVSRTGGANDLGHSVTGSPLFGDITVIRIA